MDFDFAAELDEQLMWPAYNEEQWPTRKAWLDDMIESGFYWITDYYDEDGNPIPPPADA